MYGPEDEDPVVQYYDETLAMGSPVEIGWFLDKVKEFGGPVLDIGCGTGRIALEIARKGYTVVGVDSSEGMLSIFKKKLFKEPEKIQKRVSIYTGDMGSFDVNKKFQTILCVDAFFHNVTVAEEIKCLQKVKTHLNFDGRFIFNIPNPNCEFLMKRADAYTERGTYPLETGDTLKIEEAQDIDVLTQVIVTYLRYIRMDSAGKVVDMKESSWKSRYLYYYEAVHLLYRCGFEVESVVGDYRNSPVDSGSQLIFQVKIPE
ncbi:MAG: class I SAM-dependent methyltransferase [Candidatus Methanofastidiosia archaeon]|jgi:SAM-dependent methyltransferase